MTHSARKVWQILKDNGIHVPDEIIVERTYAGRHLKAAGWAVWLARYPDTRRIICGGTGTIKGLRRDAADVYFLGGELWVEPRSAPAARQSTPSERERR